MRKKNERKRILMTCTAIRDIYQRGVLGGGKGGGSGDEGGKRRN